MSQNFEYESSKIEYMSLIEMFRKYLIHSNNIKMIAKIDEIVRNKTLKKV
jgi:hypothetical protein